MIIRQSHIRAKSQYGACPGFCTISGWIYAAAPPSTKPYYYNLICKHAHGDART